MTGYAKVSVGKGVSPNIVDLWLSIGATELVREASVIMAEVRESGPSTGSGRAAGLSGRVDQYHTLIGGRKRFVAGYGK